jgi:riboflavin kinase/FMN adenylyltransferase
MQLYSKLEEFSNKRKAQILTIGNFDGVHLGHLAVLQRVRALAQQTNAEISLLTFSNHPSEILRPQEPTKLLCTLAHKIHLLETNHIDHLLLLPFTNYLAKHSADSFVERIRQFVPFTHLILGHDATLGRDRQGNRLVMQSLAEMWGFEIQYLEEYRYEGLTVSSTSIRKLVLEGNLKKASSLLGRPYSIYSTISRGLGKGRQIGYPTANIEVQGLCLPPFGVYAVEIKYNGETLPGIANLGFAPTIRQDNIPLLEVHALANQIEFSDIPIEIVFQTYIRPEQQFKTIDALRSQIQKDIEQVKAYQSQMEIIKFEN